MQKSELTDEQLKAKSQDTDSEQEFSQMIPKNAIPDYKLKEKNIYKDWTKRTKTSISQLYGY